MTHRDSEKCVRDKGCEPGRFYVFPIPPKNTKDGKTSQPAVCPSFFGVLEAGKGGESAGKHGFPILSSQNIAKKGGGIAPSGLFPIPLVFSRDVKSSGIDGFTSSMNSEGWESVCFAEFPIPRDNSRSFAFQFRFLAGARNDGRLRFRMTLRNGSKIPR